MQAFFGIAFVILGYAIMGVASTACFIFGVVLMFTDGFWTGLAVATVGSIIAWGVGFVLTLAGVGFMENA